jgi:hypothetical protein
MAPALRQPNFHNSCMHLFCIVLDIRGSLSQVPLPEQVHAHTWADCLGFLISCLPQAPCTELCRVLCLRQPGIQERG